MLHAALTYAREGLFVLPCVQSGKEPACSNGVNGATRDEDKLRAWWADNPSYNVAIAPHCSGHFVLDVDGDKGRETLAQLELEHGLLPETLSAATPRAGSHLWFKGDAPSTVQKLGPKLDSRGEGGYVLVPPSIVQGKPYV
jgi:hypothetical protein